MQQAVLRADRFEAVTGRSKAFSFIISKWIKRPKFAFLSREGRGRIYAYINNRFNTTNLLLIFGTLSPNAKLGAS
jgi:hypothetical protein